jgi:hypothetical protein
MYETHRTTEGREMLIAEMDDSHLLNTINLFCRRIGEAVRVINLEEDVKPDKIIAHLQPRYSAANLLAKAQQELTNLDEKIAPYIVEAALRGLTVSHLLQKAYQRDAQIGQSFPGFNTDKLLEAEEE